jgi:pimeloyl-ACP methyl ester carboxylesterase
MELVEYGSFTTIDGMNIHVWVKGSGTPVILVHGFTSNLFTWRFNTEELAKEFAVSALDLPGFGYSDKPLDFDYTLDGYADFIVSFMDAMKIRKAVLVGNSMGGGISLTTTLNYPDRVDKLVLVDSMGYPRGPDEKHFLPFALMGIPTLGEILMSFNYRFVVEQSLKGGPYYDNSFVTDDVVDAYYDVYKTENAQKTPLLVIRNILSTEPLGEDVIKGVDVPTLIIWGENDNLIPARDAEYFARDIADSKAIVIPEAGHMPHEEKAELVNSLISDFVKFGN